MHFIGLPIPVMAVVVSSLYLSGIFNEHIILIIATIVSLMMISSIEYPKINAKNGAIVVILLILTILTGLKLENIRHGTPHPHHSLYINPHHLKNKK